MMTKCAPKARPDFFGVFGSGQIQISCLGSLNKGGVSTGIRTDTNAKLNNKYAPEFFLGVYQGGNGRKATFCEF